MKRLLLLAAALALPACAEMSGGAGAAQPAANAAVASAGPTIEQRQEAVGKLNEDTHALLGASEAYANAVKMAKNSEVKNTLSDLAGSRANQATAFQNAVKTLGGTPVTESGASGKLQEAFMNISALVQNDNIAAVNQVLEIEKSLSDKLNNDSTDPKLPQSTKDLLTATRDQVLHDTDRLSALKTKLSASRKTQ